MPIQLPPIFKAVRAELAARARPREAAPGRPTRLPPQLRVCRAVLFWSMFASSVAPPAPMALSSRFKSVVVCGGILRVEEEEELEEE